MRKELARSRDRLTAGLDASGFPRSFGRRAPIFSPLIFRRSVSTKTDEAFCKRIVTD